MYQWMGLEDYTCWAVADELNARGIPTHFTRDGRGLRGKKTSGGWGAGHVRNMLVNPMYKGERRYGRRSPRQGREIIICPVPALVSAELWQRAKDTLAAHVCRPRETSRFYVLRGVMKCGACGRSYIGTHSQGKIYYRCTGHLRRLGTPEVCRAAGLKAQTIEAKVWAEVERLLLEPSPPSPPSGPAQDLRPAPVDPAPLRDMLLRKDEERKRLLAAYVGEAISLAEFQAEVALIDQTKRGLEERLRALQEVAGPESPELLDEAALGALRARLGHPLDEAERRDVILAVLSRVTVHREPPEAGRKAKLIVEHRVSASSFVFYV
jgi:site-specific DNA recombinase